MRLAWTTDIHLNFLSRDAVQAWCRDVVAPTGADAVVITGDIAEADDVDGWLVFMEQQLRRPIYYVLGNHDFYGGSIQEVRALLKARCAQVENLTWMGGVDFVSLSPTTGLIGHDGWGDARHGDHETSKLVLNDFLLIKELRAPNKQALGQILGLLGDQAAAHVARVLPMALAAHDEVIMLTHVPPFREACTWKGKIANDEWAPYFSCKAVGDVLLEVMAAHPDKRLTVLCGHTHSDADVRPLPNLRVRTGTAEYEDPQVQMPLIEVV